MKKKRSSPAKRLEETGDTICEEIKVDECDSN